ncbi:MAG: (2Fe-2S)-binding protein [Planctomycetota bacterium]|nr:(2Fe-2S)-binding protein [Planctomycetota bacterium]
MDPDDDVCLCFHVSLRKIAAYIERERPVAASLVSECLGAGTGCGWCVPFLKHLHVRGMAGEPMDLRISPEAYATSRLTYRQTQRREVGPEGAGGPGAGSVDSRGVAEGETARERGPHAAE